MHYILVVLYNKRCEESDAIKSLLADKDFSQFQSIVFDNSTKELKNAAFCKKHGIIYYGFKENWGLSKAYNYVIDQLPAEAGYLIIFDDDSYFDDGYLSGVSKSIIETGCDVLLPIVYDIHSSEIISPLNTIKRKSGFQKVKKVSEIDINRISAINSGMTLSPSVYRNLKYNENLFLDCVDHDYMFEVRKTKFSISIMDCVLYQNYSRNEHPDVEAELSRFSIYVKDFREYSLKTGNRFDYKISLLSLAVTYTLRYHSFRFLTTLLKI